MKSWEAITSTSGSVKRPRSAWSGDWRSWAIRLSWSLPLKSPEEQISSLLFQKRILYRPQRSERHFLRFGQARNTGDVHPLVEPVSHYVHALACPYIPAENGSVLTSAQHHTPIGAKDHCPHPVGVPPQRVQALPRAHFPSPHRPIRTAAGKHGPIGAEGHRPDPIRMSL